MRKGRRRARARASAPAPADPVTAALRQEFYDLARPAAYAGAAALKRRLRERGIAASGKQVKAWLASQPAYAVMRPARRRFPAPKTIVAGAGEQFQADLVDMRQYAAENDGYNHILTVIDVFSKVAFAEPLRGKTGAAVEAALERVFRAAPAGAPKRLQTDAGKEFLNSRVQDLLRRHKVAYFVSQSAHKAAVVERWNRTLKTRMWRYFYAKNTHRWVDALADLVRAYNNSYHRSIGMRPTQVTPENENDVWITMYASGAKNPRRKGPKFAVGDRVRISKYKHTFAKGYTQNFSTSVYRVSAVLAHRAASPPVYKLEGLEGTFNEPELQLVTMSTAAASEPVPSEIETVLKRVGKGKAARYLVKWRGKPQYMSEWLSAEEISPGTLKIINK